jgi:hypothetical protein
MNIKHNYREALDAWNVLSDLSHRKPKGLFQQDKYFKDPCKKQVKVVDSMKNLNKSMDEVVKTAKEKAQTEYAPVIEPRSYLDRDYRAGIGVIRVDVGTISTFQIDECYLNRKISQAVNSAIKQMRQERDEHSFELDYDYIEEEIVRSNEKLKNELRKEFEPVNDITIDKKIIEEIVENKIRELNPRRKIKRGTIS